MTNGASEAAASACTDRSFDAAGVPIRYVVQGRGEPVLLVHGILGSIEEDWVAPGILPALAAEYQVLAFDCRGHGRSGKPHGADEYGVEMVDDVARMLDHLGIATAHVVGYSMGAMLAAQLLVRHPARLRSVVLGGGGILRRGDAADVALEAFADSLERGGGMEPILRFLAPVGKAAATEAEMQAVSDDVLASQDRAAIAAVARGLRTLVWDDAALQRNAAPVLAIVGTLDPMQLGVDHLRGRLANMREHGIEGGDHLDTPYRPEFAAAVRAFLAEPRSAHP